MAAEKRLDGWVPPSFGAAPGGPCAPKAFNERTGIVIGLPMTTAAFSETNPFAVRFAGPSRKASYILGHQPKSFDWRVREAKPHPKQIPEDVFTRACDTLNPIIAIG
jgi:mRNA interferase MazF